MSLVRSWLRSYSLIDLLSLRLDPPVVLRVGKTKGILGNLTILLCFLLFFGITYNIVRPFIFVYEVFYLINVGYFGIAVITDYYFPANYFDTSEVFIIGVVLDVAANFVLVEGG
jgi:hypothetical protein